MCEVVKLRYNNEPITTRANLLLFDALTKDSNDVVCDNTSSILDILNRCQIQYQLWNCVLNLRNGNYYNKTFNEFITAIDICKINKYDNPDLIYGKYDGTILKRLLSSFSFKPTVVSTMSVYNIITTNPYQQNIRPLVTYIPMIHVKLPPTINDEEPIYLKNSLEKEQYILENNILIPKKISLIYSRGVLFFYIDRRSNTIKFNNIQPFNISHMPLAISGFERLNDRQVIFENEFNIRGDTYYLRSIVTAEINHNMIEKKIIVGSSALLVEPYNAETGPYINSFYKYNPMGVIDIVNNNGKQQNRAPFYSIYEQPPSQLIGGQQPEDFTTLGQFFGTIFMYQLKEPSNVVETSI